ncbi:LysR family transcriptional regulator [Alicyclobacillus suci]|uniref:LysR family transcriptional regulator n=1 Tax=Alicyclobacillus suci TaxID=2816080 RepID=UPI001CB772EB|nr:LysR family transcriptional regulator [Alicyclobacillus suci]
MIAVLVELRDLAIFTAVARTKSVTKAAEQLGYVQSNITARIQHLERTLGTPLFRRRPRGVSLTSSGETLLHYAQRILALCSEAERALQDTQTPSGQLRIAAMETTTATRLPGILARYHEAYPNVELVLKTGSTNELINAVLHDDIEAAFVAGPVQHPQLETVAVIEEQLVLIGRDGRLELAPTDNATIVAFREGCSYRKRLEQYLDHVGITSRQVIELGTLDGILGCAAVGMGISMVPQSVVEQSRYVVDVSYLPDEYGRVPTVLIRRKDAFLSAALAKFIEAVQCM